MNNNSSINEITKTTTVPQSPFDTLPLAIFEYVYVYHTFVFIISMLANIFFFSILCSVNSGSLRAYSRVLFLTCISDSLFAIVFYMAQLVLVSQNGIVFRVLLGVPHCWPQISRIVIMHAVQFFHLFMISSLLILFVFRYSMIIK